MLKVSFVTPTYVIVFLYFLSSFFQALDRLSRRLKSYHSFEGRLGYRFCWLFFFNLAEKSKAILFCLIFGFSFRWFMIQSFSSIESLTRFFVFGHIFSFFNLKIKNEFFQFSTKNLLAIETFFQSENDFSKF